MLRTTTGDDSSNNESSNGDATTFDLLEKAIAECIAVLESGDSTTLEVVLRKYSNLRSRLEPFLENYRAAEDAAKVYQQAICMSDDLPTIAGYDIKELIGMGGMGVVYRAYSHRFEHDVALKVMRNDRFFRADDVARFWNEAKVAFQLQHRGIVSVIDIGPRDGRPYYAMKLVDGVSLKEKLHLEGPVEKRSQAIRIIRDVALAIAEAHRQGVVHRDLKPGNILIDRHGDPWVIDFGLARDMREIGKPEGFVGTPPYASPEQAQGCSHEAGAQADVYALGIVLYELLVGVPPLRGANFAETLRMTIERDPIPPQMIRSDEVNSSLDTVCRACLVKDPSNRYATARELADDLSRVERGKDPLMKPPPLKIAGSVQSTWIDLIFRTAWEEEFTKLAPMFFVFLAINSACVLGIQALILWNWGEPLAWLLAVGSCLPMFILFRSDDNESFWPKSIPERMLWAIWLSVVAAQLLTCLGARFYTGSFAEGFHLTYAMVPLFVGVGYFVMAAGFTHTNFFWGLAWMALGVVSLAVVPLPWTPTVFVLGDVCCVTAKAMEQVMAGRKNAVQKRSRRAVGILDENRYLCIVSTIVAWHGDVFRKFLRTAVGPTSPHLSGTISKMAQEIYMQSITLNSVSFAALAVSAVWVASSGSHGDHNVFDHKFALVAGLALPGLLLMLVAMLPGQRQQVSPRNHFIGH